MRGVKDKYREDIDAMKPIARDQGLYFKGMYELKLEMPDLFYNFNSLNDILES